MIKGTGAQRQTELVNSCRMRRRIYSAKQMTIAELIPEIITNYKRHGWTVRRVLLRPETRATLGSTTRNPFDDAPAQESDVDAVWFARASQGNREAWDLRLIAEQPFALFEAFEADESEEDREEARHEMENRMREYARS